MIRLHFLDFLLSFLKVGIEKVVLFAGRSKVWERWKLLLGDPRFSTNISKSQLSTNLTSLLGDYLAMH
jgi:hypothetical protein